MGSAMGLNKIRLGDYIIRSTQNNRDLKYGVELISSVTSQGVFAIPKGDPIDVNLKPYKIVTNGAFGFRSPCRCRKRFCNSAQGLWLDGVRRSVHAPKRLASNGTSDRL